MLSSPAILVVQPKIGEDPDTSSSDLKTPRQPPRTPYIPEKSQKRDFSPGSTPSPSISVQEDKRYRRDSAEFDWDNTQVNMEPEPEVTLADIMGMLKLTAKVSDLENVAKKDDLIKLQDIVSTHSLEIQQLRDDLAKQATRLQQMEDNLGCHAASMLNRTQPDVYGSRPNQYGGAIQIVQTNTTFI